MAGDRATASAATIAAKKASLKPPRRTLQDKDSYQERSSISLNGMGIKKKPEAFRKTRSEGILGIARKSSSGKLVRKGSGKLSGGGGSKKNSGSSDDAPGGGPHPPVRNGRTSVTGISDDEDGLADDVVPEPPRRVNSADGGKRRRPAFNMVSLRGAMDAMNTQNGHHTPDADGVIHL